MTYTERRIAKKMAENSEYRAAFEEEEALLAKELERRRKLMTLVTAVRKSQNLTQQQLAEKMNVTQARVSQMERGTEPFSIDSLLLILDVLHSGLAIVSPAEIERYGLQNHLVMTGEAFGKKVFDVVTKTQSGKIVERHSTAGRVIRGKKGAELV